MNDLSCYIPTDRLYALVQGKTLPDRARGAALFADISGFTPLTEALVKELGAQRGPEEITRYINAVFDSLLTVLDSYQGSAITFAGDAITCWLNEDNGLRAAACALAMQKVMQQYLEIQTPSGKITSLKVKIAIATGEVRRFIVGDPSRQVFDVLAGTTLDRLSNAEHHASPGEILVDEQTAAALGGRIEISGWKEDEDTGNRFGLLADLCVEVPTNPWPPLPDSSLSNEQLRPWLLPSVYERLTTGGGEFLGEMRPVLPMFVHFGGIDYDNDEEAGQKLGDFIRRVYGIVSDYDGSLLAILMGDKGSHLYIVFGAPMAHENDALRAVSAALAIRGLAPKLPFIDEIHIGLSQSWLFVGANGGTNRRTYVAMGDEVNIAARLMQYAGPGQIITAARIPETIGSAFQGTALGSVKLKGKENPLRVFSLESIRKRETSRLKELKYTLPMVGREEEQNTLRQKIDLARSGQGQIVGITGEAGVGKTRLAAEAVRMAEMMGFEMFSGECESYGTNTNYLVWREIWFDLFHLVRTASLNSNIYNLELQLTNANPLLVPRLPLLGTILNLPIPDNELTQSFDARLRRTSLESMLVEFLRYKARKRPLVLLLEDCQWIDELSHDLLGTIGQAITNLPVFILCTYRPPIMERIQQPLVSILPHFTEFNLVDFNPQEAEALIRLKLGQITGSEESVPPALLERITERTGGNPFYIEELLNYLRDRNVDLRNIHSTDEVELPDSLYSLILSRIDRIGEAQKVTLKVASIIGRVFKVAWITGYYPQAGSLDQISVNLEQLSRVDLTPPMPEEPELTYQFKHIITREVPYESLPYNTRRRMHGLFAKYIEDNYPENIERYIDLLAFHYDNSDLSEKRLEYLFKAGVVSQSHYANTAAIDYFRRALPLAGELKAVEIHLRLGQVLELVGRWNEAQENYAQALEIASWHGDQKAQGQCQAALGDLFRKQGRYAEALEWLEKARDAYETLGDQQGIAQVLHNWGTVAASQGNQDQANELFSKSLEIRLQINDQRQIANSYNNLGIVARYKGQYQLAADYHQKALTIRRGLGDHWMIGASLTNLGNVMTDLGRLNEAHALQEEALTNRRQSGDPWAVANVLNNLGNTALAMKQYEEACNLYIESLKINYDLKAMLAIAYLLEDIGSLAAKCGDPTRSMRLVGAANTLRKTIGAPLSDVERKKLDALLEPARAELSVSELETLYQEGERMALNEAVAYALAAQPHC